MRIFAALFFAATLPAAAQKVEVPHKMDFAGITLIIRDDARREIQKDVDALTASPRHYEIKAERARTYFPIIEKIFREEGLPDDFKYLVLQESALISDAVSTSNAVGFWQFKDFTAIEMGLRVDRHIDERMNIAASTRAAARYIIKNNQFFDNWLYALQSYQMGAGGVMKSVKDTEAKATRMDITGKTYWYVKKFLAHKIAYEGGVKGTPKNQVVLFENRGQNSLKKLASETMVDEEALKELNKWTRNGAIPDDRSYVVVLPVAGSTPSLSVADAVANTMKVPDTQGRALEAAERSRAVRGKVNGVHTIQAVTGDDARRIAARAGVDLPKFLKWNDLERTDPIIPGQIYFLGKKRLKGPVAFHKVVAGESLWEVSQRYGLRLKRLKRYNRIDEEQQPVPGSMLFLASRKPKEDDAIAKVAAPVEIDQGETFNWALKPESSQTQVVSLKPVEIDPVPESEKPPLEASVKVVDSVKILQTNKTTPTLEDTAEETVAIPASKQHVVATGETLYGIARRYGVAVMELVEWNELSLQQGIKPGQILRLAHEEEVVAEPSPEISTSEEVLHIVKTSDTLYSISRKYNVTIQEIMEWNEKKDFSLSVGEKLKIIRGQ